MHLRSITLRLRMWFLVE